VHLHNFYVSLAPMWTSEQLESQKCTPTGRMYATNSGTPQSDVREDRPMVTRQHAIVVYSRVDLIVMNVPDRQSERVPQATE
jgi:hypothetical protein